MPTRRYLKELNRALGVVEVFRGLDPDGQLPLQAVQTFLLVAMNPGCSQQLLSERTGLSQSAVSRNILALSEWARAGKRGLNLVEAVPDPQETRRKLIFLTRAGVKVAEKVLGFIVDGGLEEPLDAPMAKAHVDGVRRAAMR